MRIQNSNWLGEPVGSEANVVIVVVVVVDGSTLSIVVLIKNLISIIVYTIKYIYGMANADEMISYLLFNGFNAQANKK